MDNLVDWVARLIASFVRSLTVIIDNLRRFGSVKKCFSGVHLNCVIKEHCFVCGFPPVATVLRDWGWT